MKLADTLYSKYIKDREDADIIENEHSFVTYKITNRELIILNMFVEREHRESGICADLIWQLEQKAIDENCNVMSAQIHLFDPGCNITMQAALRLGFSMGTANQNTIVIFKNISGGRRG